MRKSHYLILLFVILSQITFAQDPLLDILKKEADRNLSELSKQEVPAYYVSYRVSDFETYSISANFGNLMNSNPGRSRLFQAFVRVGSPELDNTHELKGDNSFSDSYYNGPNPLVLDENEDAIQLVLWKKTDQLYKDAVKKYQAVKANVAVTVASEDKSDDFSKETPEQYYEKPLSFKSVLFNVKEWENKVKKYSNVFTANKEILSGSASVFVEYVRRYFVNTEGTKVVENVLGYRLFLNASATAEDGMNLPLYKSYFALHLKDLPSDDQIMADAKKMMDMLVQLKKAPIAESFSGPALMSPEASSVFFHEIFGHRIEGARLKQESDAQTFKKKVGELVLPEDFTVIFDPQLKNYRGMDLSGSYVYDDEGVKGQRVTIIDNGLLNSFLMSRTPISDFPKSNGHGRGAIYYNTVTRQSNMFIESSKPKKEDELRKMLIEEAKRTNKEYGYWIDEVSGGFTSTGRYSPNAFNVTPLVVYRIYVDGRPDELVRGVDLVGTPLAMFSQIAACGDTFGIFNGTCGAESGGVPVSCISPSLFVKMVETQKKSKSQNQPPILDRPSSSIVSSSK